MRGSMPFFSRNYHLITRPLLRARYARQMGTYTEGFLTIAGFLFYHQYFLPFTYRPLFDRDSDKTL